MTPTESFMLAVCFGMAAGTFIGNVITLIWFAIDGRKEKKRRQAEERQHSNIL